MVVLISGGSSSGKSKIAEDLALKLSGPHYYLATMRDDCEESKRKIDSHRKERATKGFTTIEKDIDLSDVDFPQKGTVLLECMGTLLSNEMFNDVINCHPEEKILKDISILSKKAENLIIVSSDLFHSLDGLDKWSLAYVKSLAYVNNSIAKDSDIVIEAVFGIPNLIKGEELCRKSDIF